MAKAAKIVDVQGPGKTAPSATGRPIVVTNRPVLANDPMMLSQNAPASAPADPVRHAAKVIQPIDEELQPAADPVDAEPGTEPAAANPSDTETTPDTAVTGPDEAPAAMEPVRDADAEAAAHAAEAEAAQAAREQELETLIEAGTYVLPINSVHRKRSRMVVWTVVILILLLVGAGVVLYRLDASFADTWNRLWHHFQG